MPRTSAYPPDEGGLAAAIQDTPIGDVLVVDSALVLAHQVTLGGGVRVVTEGGSVTGHGLRLNGTAIYLEGLPITNVEGRGIAISNASIGCVLAGVSIDGASEHGLVDQGHGTFITESVIRSSGQHGLWALGSVGASYRNNLTENNGHQGFELNSAVDYEVIGHESRLNASLGIHTLRSGSAPGKVSILKRCRTHDNQNNGIDTNGSHYVDMVDCLSWGNGSPGAEGTGILIYQAHNMGIYGGACWDNANGQPNKRDGLAIVGSADVATRVVKVVGFTGFDTRTPPSQRSAVGVHAKTPGMVSNVQINGTIDYGNVSGRHTFENLRPEDNVTVNGELISA